MDITTQSIKIHGTTNPTQAIISSLCDFGTPEEPREPTDEEKWSAIKRVRNELLTACDWTQLSDAILTVEEKEAWLIYRQKLRDIPQDFTVPDSVVFPTI